MQFTREGATVHRAVLEPKKNVLYDYMPNIFVRNPYLRNLYANRELEFSTQAEFDSHVARLMQEESAAKRELTIQQYKESMENIIDNIFGNIPKYYQEMHDLDEHLRQQGYDLHYLEKIPDDVNFEGLLTTLIAEYSRSDDEREKNFILVTYASFLRKLRKEDRTPVHLRITRNFIRQLRDTGLTVDDPEMIVNEINNRLRLPALNKAFTRRLYKIDEAFTRKRKRTSQKRVHSYRSRKNRSRKKKKT